MKRVTIITATYNLINEGRLDAFRQMFESVQEQTYSNVEHLFIDGGSKDGSVELIQDMIKEAKNQNIYFNLISEPDNGTYNAFNKGIKKASGDYIIFMNSDDYYYNENSIESLVIALEKNDAEYSFGDVLVLSKDKSLYVKSDFYKCIYTNPYCHQTMLCKKELFNEDRYGLFDEKYKIAADCKLMFKLYMDKVKFAYVPKLIACFRYCGLSSNVIEARKEIYQALKETIYLKNLLFTEKEMLNIMDDKYSLFAIFKVILVKDKELKRMLLNDIWVKKRYIFKLRFIVRPIERFIKKLKKI